MILCKIPDFDSFAYMTVSYAHLAMFKCLVERSHKTHKAYNANNQQ